jgi:hypothetical protein
MTTSELARKAALEILHERFPDESERQVRIQTGQEWSMEDKPPMSEAALRWLAVNLDFAKGYGAEALFTIAKYPEILTRFPGISCKYLSQVIPHDTKLVKVLLRLGLHPGQPERGEKNPMVCAILHCNFIAALAILHDPRCALDDYEIYARIEVFDTHSADDPDLTRQTRARVLQRISVFWMLVHGVRRSNVPWLPRDCLRLLIGFL